MGCGCKDRGAAIASATRQALKGNVGQVVRRAQFVAASAAADARKAQQAAARRATELARMRIGIGRR